MADENEIIKLQAEIERLKAAQSAARESGDIEASAAITAELEAQVETLERLVRLTEEHNKKLEEKAAKQKAVNDEEARAKQVTESFQNALKKNIKTLTGVTEQSDSLISSFVRMSQEGRGVKGALEELRDTLGEVLTAQNLATSVGEKFAEGTISVAVALDSATAGFAKATGLGKTFNSQIIDLEASNRRFGVSAAESAASFESLVGGLSGFTLMGADVQNALATEVAQLSELGVAAADSTGVLQSLTRTFGMNVDESLAFTKQTETLAQELGISLGEAVNNLNSALPQLASLAADQVAGAFEDLQKRAVETGLAVNDLIGIAGKFDTFDSAASAAGNLNAVLGVQTFDTMNLLEAQLEGPDAVVEQLRQGLLGSVSSFEELTVFQRKAIANASGLNEQEIRGLFNSKEVTEEAKKQAEEREKNLKAAMSLKDELLALVAELSVPLGGVLTVAKEIVGAFGSITKAIKTLFGGGTFGGIMATVGAMTGAFFIGKGVSMVMKKLGFGGKKGPTGAPRVYVDNMPMSFGGGGGGYGTGGGRGGGGGGGFFGYGGGGPTPTHRYGVAGGQIGPALPPMQGPALPPSGGVPNPYTTPKPKGGGGFFGKLKGFGKKIPGVGKLGALGAGAFALAKGKGGALLGGLKGLGSGVMRGLGGLARIPGIGKLAGLARFGVGMTNPLGMALNAYSVGSMLGVFDNGGGVGGRGANPAIVHGGEAVVPIEKTPAAENLATMVAQKAGFSGYAMGTLVKEIKKLNDRPIEVHSTVEMDNREFGRSVNKHFGASGVSPANSVV